MQLDCHIVNKHNSHAVCACLRLQLVTIPKFEVMSASVMLIQHVKLRRLKRTVCLEQMNRASASQLRLSNRKKKANRRIGMLMIDELQQNDMWRITVYKKF